jgi:hypothetical protein
LSTDAEGGGKEDKQECLFHIGELVLH